MANSVGSGASVAHHLRVHPFLRHIDEEGLAGLATCAELVQFKSGAGIFRVGDAADHFYLIRTGMVALELPKDAYHEMTIQLLKEGDALGWSWLFPPYEWTFDAHARTPVQAIVFDAACLRELFGRNHELGYVVTRRMAKVIADRLAAARHQIGELSNL